MRKGWVSEKLGECAFYEKGKKPKRQQRNKDDIFCHSYIDIEAFEKGIVKQFTDGEKCNFCSEEDFLMVWDGARCGLVGKGVKGALGSTLMRINMPCMENDFAYFFLQSKYQQINSMPKGTGTPHVNPNLLWNYQLPIAPLPEQRAIVAKIEKLFSELDKGIANLKAAKEKLKLYRQAVLKKAFEGKLLSQSKLEKCRKETDYEPAKNLLKKINPATKPLKVIRKDWVEVKLGDTGKILLGGTPKTSVKKYWSGTIPWITPADLSAYEEKYISRGQRNITKDGLQKSSARLIPVNSILFSSRAPIGYVAIAKNELCTNQGFKSLSPYKFLNSSFTYYQLKSLKNTAEENSSGTTFNEISKKSFSELKIKIAPLPEQRAIVREIETRFSACDKLSKTIEQSLEKSEALRQSILKKAFEGKLLNKSELRDCRKQPDWETAEKLLKRIKNKKSKDRARVKK